MKKILSFALCVFCILATVPVSAAGSDNPGLESFTTHEPWVETEMGLGLVTYPDPSPVDYPLPPDEVYVEVENDDITFTNNPGCFWVQMSDGELAAHMADARPVEVIPDEDLSNTSSQELVRLAQPLVNPFDIRVWSVRSYEKHTQNLIWEYNVIGELMGREDVTEALIAGYKYGCNYDLMELLIIADQLQNGEYSEEEKAVFAKAVDWAQGILYVLTPTSYLRKGVYVAYVSETGKFPIIFEKSILLIGFRLGIIFLVIYFVPNFLKKWKLKKQTRQ